MKNLWSNINTCYNLWEITDCERIETNPKYHPDNGYNLLYNCKSIYIPKTNGS